MFDIYEFIKSKPIAKYLKEKKYEIDAFDASCIIFNNKELSLKQKLECYEKIIEEFPKKEITYVNVCSIQMTENDIDAVKKELVHQKKAIENFFRKDENTVYTCDMYFDIYEDGKYVNTYNNFCDVVFSDYEKCLSHIKSEIEKANEFELSMNGKKKEEFLRHATIVKKILNEYEKSYVSINKNFEMVDCYASVDFDEKDAPPDYGFTMLPDLPVPFKDGDFVYDVDNPNDIYLIGKSRNYDEDIDNMSNYYMYCYDEEGKLQLFDTNYFERRCNECWINFDYCDISKDKKNKMIEDKKKLLKEIEEFRKKQIEEIEENL